MEVMRIKHMEVRPPSAASLDTYPDQSPYLFPVDITDNTVMEVVVRLSGGAGLGGAESVSLQHWILRFGAANGELRMTVADFTEWIANGQVPWVAYSDLVSV